MKKWMVFLLFSLSPIAVIYADHDEAVDGDLSGDPQNPTVIDLQVGSTVVRATSIAGDLEYFTILVPDGHVLSALNLIEYNAPSVAFLAFQNGTTFSEPANGTNPANLLGWTHLGLPLEDQLPVMQTGFGVIGYDIPLPAGDYTFWSQETSPTSPSSYALEFVVTSLSPAAPIPTLSWWATLWLLLLTLIIGLVNIRENQLYVNYKKV